jgi:hypothetical protein
VTDLRPLLESSPNPATRSLLRTALSDRPPAHARERMAMALGLTTGLAAKAAGAAGGAAVVSGGSTALTAFGVTAIAKWFAVGAVSGTLVAGGSALVQRELSDSTPRERTESTVAPAVETPRSRAGEPVPGVTPAPGREPDSSPSGGTARPGADRGVLSLSPAPDLPRPSGAPSSAVSRDAAGPLTLELERIEAARAALVARDGKQALSELALYAKVRSTGTLDREARILRIDALLLLGQVGEARELARGYLERFPKDAHTTRLRELALP